MPSTEVLLTAALLISLLVVARHVMLTHAPALVFSGYAYVLVIGYCIAYAVTRSLHVALLLGLLMVYGRAVYRYAAPGHVLLDYTGLPNTALFVAGLVATVAAAHGLMPYRTSAAVRYGLFFLLVYLQSSLIEWTLHKYVMHCYANWPWLRDTRRDDVLTRNLRRSCQLHSDHHLSVNADMTLSHVDNTHTLLFDWATLAMPAVPAFAMMLLTSRLLGLGIPVRVQAATLAALTLFFGFVWNGAHPKMHLADVAMPAAKGPPVLRGLSYPELMRKNHELHHTIKGDSKGNYNVVFLGADELLMSNNS